MAGVFLSYDRDDTDRARPLAAALEKAGHSVWWDLHVRGGAQFGKVIEEALNAADAVVVLWSVNSIESAWVKDEAAVGRDSGRLVPVSLDGTEPPLGFRQFQTIDFSRLRRRGRAAEIANLLAAVEALKAAGDELVSHPPAPQPLTPKLNLRLSRLVGLSVTILVTVAAASLLIWRPWIRTDLAVVAVRASDQSAGSQTLARDLLVQLGTLRSALSSSMRLVDAGSETSDRPDLVFKTTAAAEGGANLMLSDSKDEVLWSKQFDDPNTSSADRRQQIAFTAAGVLRCALEESSGKYGRLAGDIRQAFLDACAASADIDWDTRSLIEPLRQVTNAAPNFRPAWAQLLLAEENAATLPANASRASEMMRTLRQDIKRARQRFPDMAEATAAEVTATSDLNYLEAIALLDKAKSQDPDNPRILLDHSQAMATVGRVADELDDLRRAAQLDPLSPLIRKYLIRALVYAGRSDEARAELARAKRLWPGTETIRDAEGTVEFRYGDFEKVMRESWQLQGSPEDSLYAAARKNPTASNVQRYVDLVTRKRDDERLGIRIQALGELGRVDQVFDLLAAAPVDEVSKTGTYVLFRPWLAEARRDPRFMIAAKHFGLMTYWQKSGHWPDFCSDPGLKYDCKAEAAKLSRA
jgi:tetratricopeptide (TPR) repeat protein